MTAKEIIEDLKYFYTKINFGASYLDAKAVTIMNEIEGKIIKLEKEKNDRQRG